MIDNIIFMIEPKNLIKLKLITIEPMKTMINQFARLFSDKFNIRRQIFFFILIGVLLVFKRFFGFVLLIMILSFSIVFIPLI